MQAALSDVEAAVSRIRTLPEDAKTPETRRIARYETILRVVLSGSHTEEALKAHAKRLRDGLLDRGIDRITATGMRDEEILVEAPSAALRRLDMTLADIGARIRESSRDLPAGDVGQGRRHIRSRGLVTTARGIEDIEIKALEDGRAIRLGDVARVREGFGEDTEEIRRNGRRAIELHVQRAVQGDALKMAKIAEAYLDEVAPTLPATLDMERYDVAVGSLRDRIDLLIRNGASGLAIVIVILMVFLRARVAFWVMVGIPASLLAAFGVMLAVGLTINMVSLFSLIMTVGIIVDDAIVVGEHADTRGRQGLSPLAAAIDGAHRMAVPVFAAALTTISAFLPLLMISGVLGQIIATIPLVVVAVLIASLMECFLVLPGHLSVASTPSPTGWPARYRRWFDDGFAAFRDGPFRSFVEVCIHWRYATLAVAVGLMLLAAGMVAGGRVGFTFFPSPEADRVFANVTMVPGTPREATVAMLDEANRALDATVRELEGDDSDLVRMAITKIGIPASGGVEAGDNVGGGRGGAASRRPARLASRAVHRCLARQDPPGRRARYPHRLRGPGRTARQRRRREVHRRRRRRGTQTGGAGVAGAPRTLSGSARHQGRPALGQAGDDSGSHAARPLDGLHHPDGRPPGAGRHRGRDRDALPARRRRDRRPSQAPGGRARHGRSRPPALARPDGRRSPARRGGLAAGQPGLSPTSGARTDAARSPSPPSSTPTSSRRANCWRPSSATGCAGSPSATGWNWPSRAGRKRPGRPFRT